MTKIPTIKIEDDGKIKIPKTLMQEYNLKPSEEVRILPSADGLRIEKVPTEDHPYNKFLRLLEEGLKGASWK